MMDKLYKQAADFLLDDSFCAYCLGADPVAQQYWIQWQLQHPELLPVFREAVALFQAVNTTDRQPQDSWTEFEQLLKQRSAQVPARLVKTYSLPVPGREAQPNNKQKSLYRHFTFAAAACVAGILLLGAAFIIFSNMQPTPAIAGRQAFDTLRTAKGEQKKILLADNSTVILNYNSTLIVPQQFDKTAFRSVQLSGEAVFYVKTDANRPFTVQSGKLKTTVLGTVFNVNAYTNANQVAITVLEGKVGVASGKDSTTLLPDRQAIYSAATDSLISLNTDAASLLAWKEGKLRFRENTLENIAFALENKFDTAVRFRQPEIAQELYTASFERNMSLEAIAKVLCTGRNLQYTMQNNTLWFSYRKQMH
ncbi:FecR domain-containing protein [Chitinophaga sp. YIM B06452]|uniref:FecR family protein n=1 Tax=Chitinophaga sp. YIM B06452 TaxID=3082158 RepID=UPI0031FEF014